MKFILPGKLVELISKWKDSSSPPKNASNLVGESDNLGASNFGPPLKLWTGLSSWNEASLRPTEFDIIGAGCGGLIGFGE